MAPTAATVPPARQRILDTAFHLFYAHGPRGVGVDTIIAESGVAKATLYKYFRCKDDLVLAYLDKVDEVWVGQLREAASAGAATAGGATARGATAGARLVGMFDALVSAFRTDGYHGCAFINTAAESAPHSAVHARTVAHKQFVRAWVTEMARGAGAADPELLAQQLTLLLDGALAAGVLDANVAAVSAAKAAAQALVEVSCGELTGRAAPRPDAPLPGH
jgi:AcrR family transcriptional regulator